MIVIAPVLALHELEGDMGLGGLPGAWCHYSHSLVHPDPYDKLPKSLTAREGYHRIILLGPSQPSDIKFPVFFFRLISTCLNCHAK